MERGKREPKWSRGEKKTNYFYLITHAEDFQ